MAAEIGNKYAEKWTREVTILKLQELSSVIETTLYIGEGLALIGLYHQWFSWITDKFKDDDEVFDMIKRIEQSYEVRLVKGSMLGQYNPTMTIFTLKNKHSWKDKSEVENSGSMNIVWNEEKTYEAKS